MATIVKGAKQQPRLKRPRPRQIRFGDLTIAIETKSVTAASEKFGSMLISRIVKGQLSLLKLSKCDIAYLEITTLLLRAAHRARYAQDFVANGGIQMLRQILQLDPATHKTSLIHAYKLLVELLRIDGDVKDEIYSKGFFNLAVFTCESMNHLEKAHLGAIEFLTELALARHPFFVTDTIDDPNKSSRHGVAATVLRLLYAPRPLLRRLAVLLGISVWQDERAVKNILQLDNLDSRRRGRGRAGSRPSWLDELVPQLCRMLLVTHDLQAIQCQYEAAELAVLLCSTVPGLDVAQRLIRTITSIAMLNCHITIGGDDTDFAAADSRVGYYNNMLEDGKGEKRSKYGDRIGVDGLTAQQVLEYDDDDDDDDDGDDDDYKEFYNFNKGKEAGGSLSAGAATAGTVKDVAGSSGSRGAGLATKYLPSAMLGLTEDDADPVMVCCFICRRLVSLAVQRVRSLEALRVRMRSTSMRTNITGKVRNTAAAIISAAATTNATTATTTASNGGAVSVLSSPITEYHSKRGGGGGGGATIKDIGIVPGIGDQNNNISSVTQREMLGWKDDDNDGDNIDNGDKDHVKDNVDGDSDHRTVTASPPLSSSSKIAASASASAEGATALQAIVAPESQRPANESSSPQAVGTQQALLPSSSIVVTAAEGRVDANPLAAGEGRDDTNPLATAEGRNDANPLAAGEGHDDTNPLADTSSSTTSNDSSSKPQENKTKIPLSASLLLDNKNQRHGNNEDTTDDDNDDFDLDGDDGLSHITVESQLKILRSEGLHWALLLITITYLTALHDARIFLERKEGRSEDNSNPGNGGDARPSTSTLHLGGATKGGGDKRVVPHKTATSTQGGPTAVSKLQLLPNRYEAALSGNYANHHQANMSSTDIKNAATINANAAPLTDEATRELERALDSVCRTLQGWLDADTQVLWEVRCVLMECNISISDHRTRGGFNSTGTAATAGGSGNNNSILMMAEDKIDVAHTLSSLLLSPHSPYGPSHNSDSDPPSHPPPQQQKQVFTQLLLNRIGASGRASGIKSLIDEALRRERIKQPISSSSEMRSSTEPSPDPDMRRMMSQVASLAASGGGTNLATSSSSPAAANIVDGFQSHARRLARTRAPDFAEVTRPAFGISAMTARATCTGATAGAGNPAPLFGKNSPRGISPGKTAVGTALSVDLLGDGGVVPPALPEHQYKEVMELLIQAGKNGELDSVDDEKLHRLLKKMTVRTRADTTAGGPAGGSIAISRRSSFDMSRGAHDDKLLKALLAGTAKALKATSMTFKLSTLVREDTLKLSQQADSQFTSASDHLVTRGLNTTELFSSATKTKTGLTSTELFSSPRSAGVDQLLSSSALKTDADRRLTVNVSAVASSRMAPQGTPNRAQSTRQRLTARSLSDRMPTQPQPHRHHLTTTAVTSVRPEQVAVEEEERGGTTSGTMKIFPAPFDLTSVLDTVANAFNQ